jgi:hypothetical protein
MLAMITVVMLGNVAPLGVILAIGIRAIRVEL